jgi:hypothetical protein
MDEDLVTCLQQKIQSQASFIDLQELEFENIIAERSKEIAKEAYDRGHIAGLTEITSHQKVIVGDVVRELRAQIEGMLQTVIREQTKDIQNHMKQRPYQFFEPQVKVDDYMDQNSYIETIVSSVHFPAKTFTIRHALDNQF